MVLEYEIGVNSREMATLLGKVLIVGAVCRSETSHPALLQRGYANGLRELSLVNYNHPGTALAWKAC